MSLFRSRHLLSLKGSSLAEPLAACEGLSLANLPLASVLKQQLVGLPYFAHQPHAPDTTLIAAEPDFVSFAGGASIHEAYMSDVEPA